MCADNAARSDNPGQPDESDTPVGGAGHEPGSQPPQSQADQVSLSRAEHAELLKKSKEREAFLDELLRTRADFENYRKRILRDKATWDSQTVRRVIQDLLPVLDNFERALEKAPEKKPPARPAEAAAPAGDSIQAGILLIYQLLQKFLEKYQIEEIPALNQPFDPELHDAVQEMPIDDPKKHGKVVQVLQKGYTFEKSIILRPAKVLVGKSAA